MVLPKSSDIELPVLHELAATGGSDDVRFLYDRLIAYFPAITEAEINEIRTGTHAGWRKAVQKAGKMLDEQNLLSRDRGFWQLTTAGAELVARENTGFTLARPDKEPLSHGGAQEMLLEIGEILGFFAEAEFEYYDVVWRETPHGKRLSHVFEVQSKGNLDSAFAKLKRAYIDQRSKPFLVVAAENDSRRAFRALEREFQELHDEITIISFAELERVYQNLQSVAQILPKFLNT